MWCIEFLDMYSGFILLFIFSNIHSNALSTRSNLHHVLSFLSQSKSSMWKDMITPKKFISQQDYHAFDLFCQILEFYKIDKRLQWVPLRSKNRLLECFKLVSKFISINISEIQTKSFFAIFYGFFKVVVPLIHQETGYTSEEALILADIITPMLQSSILKHVEELNKKRINYFTQIYPAESCFRFVERSLKKPLAPDKKVKLINALKDGMKSMILERQVMVKFDIVDLFMTPHEKYQKFLEEQKRVADQKVQAYQAENAELLRKIKNIEEHRVEFKPQDRTPIDRVYDTIPTERIDEVPKIREIPDEFKTDDIRTEIQGIPPIQKTDLIPQLSDDKRLQLISIQKDMKKFMKKLEKK